MADQHEQHGVLTECAVTAQVSPNMTVAVAAGSVINANIAATVTAQNATITAADATLDRIDTLTVGNTGTVTVNAGTPAATPIAPDSADVEIAQVYVYSQANANYTGTIVSSVIQDTRRYALIHTSPYRLTNQWYPAVETTSAVAAISVLNDMLLQPLFVAKDLSVKTIAVGLKSNYAAGAVARLGIYSDDGAGSLSLLVDAGTVAMNTGAPSLRSITITETLTPGWWWLAVVQQVSITSGLINTYARFTESPIGMSDPLNNPSVGYVVSGVSGALPSAPAVTPGTSQNNVGVWVQAA